MIMKKLLIQFLEKPTVEAVFLKLVERVSVLMPLKKLIILESIPILSDNTYCIYEQLIKRRFNQTYTIIWIYSADDMRINSYIGDLPHNVHIFRYDGAIKSKLALTRLKTRAKFLISANVPLTKVRNSQKAFYLTHGDAMKDIGDISHYVGKHIDGVLTSSDWFVDVSAKNFQISPDKIYPLGLPRCDYLFSNEKSLQDLADMNHYDKIIAWLPTIRQRISGKKDVDTIYESGIPIIESEAELKELNRYLEANKTLLVLKIHFIQDRQFIKINNMSNILLIDNNYLATKGWQLYEFLGHTDGLITDYSSVYYDYLLCHKPIGLTVDDLDAYISQHGIIFDDYFDNIKGIYINTLDDLKRFIQTVQIGERCSWETNDRTSRYQKYWDYQATDRVMRLLEEEGLRNE